MKSSKKQDLGTKIYIGIDNLFNGNVSIKKDWWLVTAILEGIRSLDLFVIYAKANSLSFVAFVFLIIAIGLLLRSKLMFWIGSILSILNVFSVGWVVITKVEKFPTDYISLVYTILVCGSFYILWRKIQKEQKLAKH